jgi:hypothetical protein
MSTAAKAKTHFEQISVEAVRMLVRQPLAKLWEASAGHRPAVLRIADSRILDSPNKKRGHNGNR